MKKIKLFVAIVLIGVFALVQTGCIGSFALTKKVYEFNRSFDNKFVQEAVMIGLMIIPVYEVAGLIDFWVLNLIEFWTGDNLLGMTNSNGEQIDLVRNGNSYLFTNNTTGEQVNVYYDAETNSVFANTRDGVIKLVEIMDNNQALVYLPNGETKTVDLTGANNMHFALK